MATKIKRCLYVGLGGTGMNALLHTKKMFIDTYGEVHPMIGFLGIDTDGGAYKKAILSNKGEANEKPWTLFTIPVPSSFIPLSKCWPSLAIQGTHSLLTMFVDPILLFSAYPE